MSTLDWILVSVFLVSVIGCAGMGLVRAVCIGVGAVASYLIAVPLLTEPIATVTGWLVGWLGAGSSGWARLIAIGAIVVIGMAIGGLVGKIISLPINILPGINLLNTMGGAAAGLAVGIVLVGVTVLGARLIAPEWTQTELLIGSFVSTFIGDNIGKLAVTFAPTELKTVLNFT
jgi:Colicin V production protein